MGKIQVAVWPNVTWMLIIIFVAWINYSKKTNDVVFEV
jgi:hypothetical protein